MRISLTGNYRIASKPAKALVLTAIVGTIILGYVPKDWDALRAIALALSTFTAGMLASQHTKIWEKVE